MKTVRILLICLCAVAALSCSREQGDRFYRLRNHAGMEVTVTNYGGRIVSVAVPDRDGVKRDVVLGFEAVEDYYPENNRSDFGAAVGRYANRIAGGRFTLDGVEYELPKNDLGHCLQAGRKAGSTSRSGSSRPMRATSACASTPRKGTTASRAP